MSKRLVCMAVLMFGMAVFARSGHAVIYQYTDKNGVVCYADDLQKVPEAYRPQAAVVSGGVTSKDGAAQSGPVIVARDAAAPFAAQTVQEESSGAQHWPFASRLLLSILVVGVSLGGYRLAVGQSAVKKQEQALKVVRGVGYVALTLFLLYVHLRDVVFVYRSIAGTIDTAQENSARKGKQAADFMKAVDRALDAAQQNRPPEPAEHDAERR